MMLARRVSPSPRASAARTSRSDLPHVLRADGPCRRAGATMTDGLLRVDKPEGPTSHDIVAAVRRAFGGARCGHAGTLDPFATGLLVLALGRATRLLRFLDGDDKTYLGDIRL